MYSMLNLDFNTEYVNEYPLSNYPETLIIAAQGVIKHPKRHDWLVCVSERIKDYMDIYIEHLDPYIFVLCMYILTNTRVSDF